jgi:hypothetical protein
MDEHGFGKGAFSYSVRIGGEKNGVRAAVEEFVAKNSGWRAAYSAAFYGLGLLWKEDSFSPALSEYMRDLVAALERAEPALATLEWNRILLYIQTQFMGAEWWEQHSRIERLEDQLRSAGTIWKEQQSWIGHLEDRLRRAGVRF